MKNKKQTAVEWLIEELGEYFPIGIGGIELMVEKAKKIPRQIFYISNNRKNINNTKKISSTYG